MRFLIRHETTFEFEPAARLINGLIRLTPRNHEGQFVAKWRATLDVDGRLRPSDDAFGNIVHGLTFAGPLAHLTVRVEGEIGTLDTGGSLRGTLERFPPEFFLRETALTAANARVRDYCRKILDDGKDPLARLHALLAALHQDMARDQEPEAADPVLQTAAAVISLGAGTADGLAHAFIACAHHMAIPARFAYGTCPSDDAGNYTLRGWAEAYVEGAGWMSFDPALGRCSSERHVRIGCGLDAIAASPVRIAASGPDHTTRTDRLHISGNKA